MKPTLVLLCVEQRLAAWYVVPPNTPEPQPIHGQADIDLSDRAEHANELVRACADLAERLMNKDIAQVHWLLDQPGRSLWLSSQPELEKLGGFLSSPWQLLAWEWLAARFGWSDASPWDYPDVLTSEWLPWLVAADETVERQQMLEALHREHHSETERLAAERAVLDQEIKRLREQLAALQRVDASQLLRFLPALYPRVFTVIGAADLALLCGQVEPLPIPNPYPEPSEETLRVLQKDFRAMPRKLQQQIVGFVARLPHRQKLQPRPELRDLIEELEQS